jgi:hypothetical protein
MYKENGDISNEEKYLIKSNFFRSVVNKSNLLDDNFPIKERKDSFIISLLYDIMISTDTIDGNTLFLYEEQQKTNKLLKEILQELRNQNKSTQ